VEYIYTNKPIEQAAEHIATVLGDHLSNNQQVLWLLSGGSSLEIALIVSKKLRPYNLSNLHVSMTDERYGPIGHSDENWQQLINIGFELDGADLYRPLIGKDIKTTAAAFNDWLSDQLNNSDFTLGIFGVGTDGHTAGIKPYSPAINSSDFVTSFSGDDFERVTISPRAIAKIDEAVVQISGSDKQQVLSTLLNDELPIDEQPAQILKPVQHTTIYSNILNGGIK
jgi:6-phosphogluconolactonase/glucosamine-6-phosphate isomerase/deaminase